VPLVFPRHEHPPRRNCRRTARERAGITVAATSAMRTIQRLMFATVIASLALSTGTAAQVLTSSEVQKLMEQRQPADHVKLQAHFAALSTRYAADAARHETFARAAGTGRGANAAASAHHGQLAKLARESATITRELASHHSTLAAGQPSTAPTGAEAYEAGAGAPDIPEEKRLLLLAAGAARPSEHGLIREYYVLLAQRYEKAATDQRAVCRMYRGQSRPSESTAVQCDRLVTATTGAAREARALAREHQ
jgi:hypothetical protein